MGEKKGGSPQHNNSAANFTEKEAGIGGIESRQKAVCAVEEEEEEASALTCLRLTHTQSARRDTKWRSDNGRSVFGRTDEGRTPLFDNPLSYYTVGRRRERRGRKAGG